MKPLLCIDFDSTITDDVKVPLPGCVERLTQLQRSYTIGIFSARATQPEIIQMVRFLQQHNVPYDVILPPKPNAVAFVDDKGWKFESWDKVPASF